MWPWDRISLTETDFCFYCNSGKLFITLPYSRKSELNIRIGIISKKPITVVVYWTLSVARSSAVSKIC